MMFPENRNGAEFERVFVAFFIFLVFVSVVCLFFLDRGVVRPAGVCGFLWAAFTLKRFISLGNTEHRAKESKGVPLPEKLIGGLREKWVNTNRSVLFFMGSPDFAFWFAVGLFVVVWGWGCFFFPDENFLLAAFNEKVERFFATNGSTPGNLYRKNLLPLISSSSVLFSFGMVVVNARSYSYSRLNDRFFIFPLLFLLAVLFVASLSLSGIVGSIAIGEFVSMKGAGFGSFALTSMLAGDEIKEGLSPFVSRLIENGIVGVFAVYMLFIPPLFIFVRRLYASSGKNLPATVGVVCVCVMMFHDLLFLKSGFTAGLYFCGWAIIAYCWGRISFEEKEIIYMRKKYRKNNS